MFPKPTFKTKRQRRRAEEEEYRKRRRSFLNQKRRCELNVVGRCRDRPEVATDVHHTQGREGDLLLDESKWLAGCRPCHLWVEHHPDEAYRLGLKVRRN